jgi:2'-5' RNA ligase
MRLFIAVPLPAVVIAELSAISLRLRSNGDGLRWSAPESWHITLQFLGNTDEEHYECVVSRLREVRLKPVPVHLEGLGTFDRTGVLFVGVTVTPELLLLQRRVTVSTEACGFVPEARAFQPHITLARSKDRRQGLCWTQGQDAFSAAFQQVCCGRVPSLRKLPWLRRRSP